jgi:hypothetical protein
MGKLTASILLDSSIENPVTAGIAKKPWQNLVYYCF